MTRNRISALAALVGITFLGLAGCQSQPYKPWQPDNSSSQKEEQARMDAEATEMTAAVKKMQTTPPVAMTESVPAPVEPVIMKPVASISSKTKTSKRTSGDVLLIDSIQSAPAILTPRNGSSMASVRQQYGEPVSEGNGIGDPPITRWEYKNFSVYFEHDLVLHSVVHRPNRN